MVDEGRIRSNESGSAGSGGVEGEWDGVTTVSYHSSMDLAREADGECSTTRSDWLAWERPREPLERAIYAF